MDSKTRLLTAWQFREPDRVPIEMRLYAPAKDLPGADEVLAFQENEADNFAWAPGFNWGFMGLDTTYREETIEDVPGVYKRLLKTHDTPVGPFTAVTKHNYDDADPNDFHTEKHFIETLDDFRRLAGASRAVRPFFVDDWNRVCAAVGGRGLPSTGLFHPLGTLLRSANLTEVYAWLLTEERLMEAFLESCTAQVVASLGTIKGRALSEPPVFLTYALEMLIPPWLGRVQFDKWVFPFDSRVNAAVHEVGGRHRAHCHGNSGAFLERFADMGLDGVEPLEPPPYGDNVLADAKRRVGGRLLLSGNIPSQLFALDSFRPADVREWVKRAIGDGATGGGFTLRTTGGAAGNGKTRAQCIKSLSCTLAFIAAWREFSA